jgi:hypothetical protein
VKIAFVSFSDTKQIHACCLKKKSEESY